MTSQAISSRIPQYEVVEMAIPRAFVTNVAV